MHAGNIYSALVTWLICHKFGGSVALRIEDLDPERSKQRFADQIMWDFESLGLTWDEGPFYQHDREEAYHQAFLYLKSEGMTYPCYCSRADLKAASAPHGQDHWVYSGTCRTLTAEQQQDMNKRLLTYGGKGPSWRLKLPGDNLVVSVQDVLQGGFTQDLTSSVGDFIIRRADGACAYQLAVVLDDAEQGINFVSRGFDLLSSSPQQRYLQTILGLPHTAYAHFPLMCAADGRRLAKRDKSATFQQLVSVQGSPQAVIGHVAYLGGIQSEDTPCTPEDLLRFFDMDMFAQNVKGVQSIYWQ